ncbi:MAG: hypothetical protein ACREXK_06525 [Gammaproteobacteria bacterium]
MKTPAAPRISPCIPGDNPASNLRFVNTEYGGPTATVGKVQDWQRVANQGSTLPAADVQAVNGCVQAARERVRASGTVPRQAAAVGYQDEVGRAPFVAAGFLRCENARAHGG